MIVNIQIKNANFFNYKEVAKIHKECLAKSFLATLGEKFLTLLYKILVEYKKGILVVAEDDGKLLGLFQVQQIQKILNIKYSILFAKLLN